MSEQSLISVHCFHKQDIKTKASINSIIMTTVILSHRAKNPQQQMITIPWHHLYIYITHSLTYTHMHAHMYAHAHTHACAHTRTHTHTHTHTKLHKYYHTRQKSPNSR
jgi:hypothetical protein